ncbi:MAG TPA: NFACT RNA binding domain-containing protein [Bacillota bacterium]|nr:NFACT RNA binding domain-containing protein [Bacillota bacterium]
MPLDGITTHFLALELNHQLAGARIDKVYQPDRFDIHLLVRTNNNKNLRILLSANPASPRIHITESPRENPNTPPSFCMLLRKHLSGARILAIRAFDFERIIELEISTTNELQDVSVKRIIIEMMGRYSNIIFVNEENRIIDSLFHVDSQTSRVREVMPARIYEAPPKQGKIMPNDALSRIESGHLPILDTSMGRPIEKALLESITGFSPILARDICYQADVDGRIGVRQLSPEQENALIKALHKMLSCIVHEQITPGFYLVEGIPKEFHVLKLKDAGTYQTAKSISDAMEQVTSACDAITAFENRRRRLVSIIDTSLLHATKKCQIHEDDLIQTDNLEELKTKGELILSYQYLIQEHDDAITIPDYPNIGESLTIALNPNIAPSVQGQSYFKKYRKGKAKRASALSFIEEERDAVLYLKSIRQAIDAATNMEDLFAIEAEMTEESIQANANKEGKKKTTNDVYHPGKSKSGKSSSRALREAAKVAKAKEMQKKASAKARAEAPSYRTFTVDSHFTAICGRNNIQNDQLTFKTASKDDLWFHVKNMPGTHVILRLMGEIPTEKAITEAAAIAAYYSSSNHFRQDEASADIANRNGPRVEVDYCPVSHVKKIPKAKPGMVTYANYKTLLVNGFLPKI